MAVIDKNIYGGLIWLWVKYTQGTEDSVTLTFKCGVYDLLESDNATAVSISLVGTQSKIYQIRTPMEARFLRINADYVNPVKSGTFSFAGDGTTLTFSTTLDTVVQASSISISYTIAATAYTATDDGAGNITGTDLTGTINYSTGALALTFTTAPDASTTISGTYNYENKGTVSIETTR